LCCFVATFIAVASLSAQSLNYDWDINPHNNDLLQDYAGYSIGDAMVTDKSGNVYCTFYCSKVDNKDSIDIDPPNSVYIGKEYAVIKYDAFGNYVWSKFYNVLTGLAITLDTADNLVVLGRFSKTLTSRSKNITDTLLTGDPTGFYASWFMAKYDKDGHLLFCKEIGREQGFEFPIFNNSFQISSGKFSTSTPSADLSQLKLRTDPSNNVIWCVGIGQGLLLYGSPNVDVTIKRPKDFLLAKFNENGKVLWANNVSNAGSNINRLGGLSVDSNGHIFMALSVVSDSIYLDPHAPAATLGLVNGSPLLVIAKYNKQGGFMDAYPLYNNRSDLGKTNYPSCITDITTDGKGHLYCSGVFHGKIDLDPDPGSDFLLQADTTYADAFLAKYDLDGKFRNAIQMQASGPEMNEVILGLSPDQSGNLYITGAFTHDIKFDLGGGQSTSLSSPWALYKSSGDIFMAKYNGDLTCQWATALETLSAGGGSSFPTQITVDRQDNVLLVGHASGCKIDVAPATADTLERQGPFLVKLRQSCEREQLIKIKACDQYEYGGTLYTSSVTITDTFRSEQGCDSIVTVALTINPSPTASFTQTDSLLTAGTAEAWQWVNCATNEPIDSAVEQNYTAPQPGRYAVILSSNGCADTSDCVEVNWEPEGGDSNVAVEQVAGPLAVQLYPNPVKDRLFIKSEWSPRVQDRFVLTTSVGSVVREGLVSELIKSGADVSGLPAGMYYLKLQGDKKEQYVWKVIKL